MNFISYLHKSVELLFQILGRIEVWTRRSKELSPKAQLRSLRFKLLDTTFNAFMTSFSMEFG
jgi:hypothetical protein